MCYRTLGKYLDSVVWYNILKSAIYQDLNLHGPNPAIISYVEFTFFLLLVPLDD